MAHSVAATTRRRAKHSRGRKLYRSIALAIVLAIAGAAILTASMGGRPRPAVAADRLEDPQLVKLLSFNDRQDDVIDEFRADFILKVPRGFVDPISGALTPVNGQYLRLGYDHNEGSIRYHLRYKPILGQGPAGAANWAANHDQYYTIHEVVPSGNSDFLVISAEGDRNISDNQSAANIPGGLLSTMNLYFSYENSPPTSTSSSWTSSARVVHPLEYYIYYGSSSSRSIVGPQLNIQYNGTASLWSKGQASWGLSLSQGVNGAPPGVAPLNSLSIDPVNNPFSSASRGPTGSVTDSFWYAWVHENGSLVTAINTAPIRVTGVPPRGGGTSGVDLVSKNIAQHAKSPQLGWTPEQAAQGLTERVGVDGTIDFRDAGGNGFYRLLAWPESHDPETINGDYGAPRLSYSPSDLFDANGMITPNADLMKFTPATVFNNYQLALPAPPHIDVPAHGSALNTPGELKLSGSGEPGHTITLKLLSGSGIGDYHDPGLTTIIDGDHAGVQAADVVVDPGGAWSYTYVPPEAFADGSYTVTAAQTDQHPDRWYATSGMSNPQEGSDPPQWGVTFTVDTLPPPAPSMVCPVSPAAAGDLTVTGAGVEPGATVAVMVDGTRSDDATVSDSSWSYTFDPPLGNGTYAISAVQTDAAGNQSPVSTPVCTVRVALPVQVTGEKTVQPVAAAAPQLEDAAADNWEITATGGPDVLLLSGEAPAQLQRDTAYRVDERPRADPPADPLAERYRPAGDPVCADATGAVLPTEVFDPATRVLMFASDADVAEPVSCSLANQAAQVSAMAHRLGGQTTLLPEGWGLTVSPGSGADIALTHAEPRVIAAPGEATLTPAVPQGLSLLGVQALDLTQPDCAALAPTAGQAPRHCWVDLDRANNDAPVDVPQGAHSVFRVIAATPAELPALPLTGGIGSLTYWLAGAGALVTAGLVYLRRRRLDRLRAAAERRAA
ncbi:Ig-like domain-containing protein [Leucobacter albus]|uniref:Ig-like domain-containing protein n=1 Tax=Leucobacter albus TaxID=272210 RepID=A0ABW3TN46_9MICO